MGNEDKRLKQHSRHKRHKGHRPKEMEPRRPDMAATPSHSRHKRPAETLTHPSKRPKVHREEQRTPQPDEEAELLDAVEIDVGGADDELHTKSITVDSPKASAKAASTSKPVKPPQRKVPIVAAAPTKTPSPSFVAMKISPTPSSTPSASSSMGVAGQTPTNPNKKKRRRESGTSSDEERWLTAIESGKLEEVDDEMKKIKDPKLMTARQRAMYERNTDKEPSPGGELLMSLPTGYREKEKPQTAEDIQKAALKSQKRKQLADEKREKDKKKTMERLLKKQESKQRSAARNKAAKATLPMIVYKNTAEGAFIHLPAHHEFPLEAQTPREPPARQMCGIQGCDRPKVYNCSKTNIPLCSIECYRKNVQSVKSIIC